MRFIATCRIDNKWGCNTLDTQSLQQIVTGTTVGWAVHIGDDHAIFSNRSTRHGWLCRKA